MLSRAFAYIQADTPDGADFCHGQRRKDSVNDFDSVRQRPRVQRRGPAEDGHLDLLSLADGDTNVNITIHWLTNEHSTAVTFRDEADKS